jgi:membrane protease YdiL (CAAX protease family)
VSILLGVAYARTDNLAVPVLAHAAYNASTILLSLAITTL